MPNRISRGRALPVDLFGDDAVYEIEIAEIWHKDWVFATPVDAVAEPGQFVPVTIGRQPVIIVRGEDHRLHALANVCSHRGARLVDCAGTSSRFSCPYHGWSYSTEGTLTSVPYAQPKEVVHADHGLESFRVETWHDLVFVCLDPEVESLADRVAVIEPYVRPMGIGRLHHDVDNQTCETWKANWKLVFANAVDSYSHFRVHPESVEPFSPTDASYYLAGSARATVTGGESADRADHLVIALPPSFVAVVFPDSMFWQALAPGAVGETTVTTGVAGERTSGDGLVSIPGWDAAFVDEDRRICEQVQRNASVRWTPGPLLDIERALGDFHDYLAWRLAGRDPDAPVTAARPGERPDPLG